MKKQSKYTTNETSFSLKKAHVYALFCEDIRKITRPSPTWGVFFALQDEIRLFFSQSKHHVFRKLSDVVPDLPVEVFGLVTMDCSKVRVQHDLHATDGVNPVADIISGDCHWN